jgi:hypothetical protein
MTDLDDDDIEAVTIEAEEDEGEDLDESVSTIGGERFDAKDKHTKTELEEWADKLLREDANKEMCRQCVEAGVRLPYGEPTGVIEYMPAMDKQGNAIIDDETEETKYVEFPELQCAAGHRWYKGEGPRRDIRGENPILFEPHLYNRKRRELLAKEGVVDPAYTMDRWGKRPTVGLYGRSHPQGRKINSKKQRTLHGAGFISDLWDLLSLPGIESSFGTLIWYSISNDQKTMQPMQQDQRCQRVLEERQGQGWPGVFVQAVCQGVSRGVAQGPKESRGNAQACCGALSPGSDQEAQGNRNFTDSGQVEGYGISRRFMPLWRESSGSLSVSSPRSVYQVVQLDYQDLDLDQEISVGHD